MKPIAAVLMIFMLSSCDMLRENKFEITNETGHELEEVQVSFANASTQRQSLGPGETLSFRPSPDHDGMVGRWMQSCLRSSQYRAGTHSRPLQ